MRILTVDIRHPRHPATSDLHLLLRQVVRGEIVLHVVTDDIVALSARLEPLAELTPPRRTPMDPKDDARLRPLD